MFSVMQLVESCLGPKEVAAMLGVSDRTVQRLMRSGKLESFRVGPKLWRTLPGKVEAYKASSFDRYRRDPAGA